MPTWLRPLLLVSTLALASAAAQAVPAEADARVLRHEATGFSVRAGDGYQLTFNSSTGIYRVASPHGGASVGLLSLRTGASPARAGRRLLGHARSSVARQRSGGGSYVARLPQRRTLSIRSAPGSRLSVAIASGQGPAAARSGRLGRIARSARGGRSYTLRHAASLARKLRQPGVTLAWATPAAGARVSGELDIEVVASQPSDVESVRFYVDGRHFHTEYWEDYEAELDTRRLSPGGHRLRAVATLDSGRSVSTERQIYVGSSGGSSPAPPKPTPPPEPKPTPPPDPGPGPAPSPPPSSAPFTADFEDGTLRPFRFAQAESDDRVRAVGSPAGVGRYSARFEVRRGDEAAGGNRAEVTGPSFAEGDDVWFRQSIRLPSDSALEDRWQMAVQYSCNGEGPPALALFVVGPVGGGYRLELRAGDSSRTYWRSSTLAFDRWQDVGVHVRFSGGSGFVEVYQDGAKQSLANGDERMPARTIEYGKAYYKTGLYRSREHVGTSVIYHDHILIGPSGSSVGLGG